MGVVPQKESRLTLLDDLGSLWDEFSLRYDEFDTSLDGMETTAAKKLQDQFVKGKSFEEYYQEAETVYQEAENKVTKLIRESTDKKTKQDKLRVERDLNISSTAIEGIVGLIGHDNLTNPDTFQSTEEPQIQEYKMMVRRLTKCLADQQENLDKAEEVEEVDDDIIARATGLIQTYQAQGDNFDLRLESLLVRVNTIQVGNQTNTPPVTVEGNQTNTPPRDR